MVVGQHVSMLSYRISYRLIELDGPCPKKISVLTDHVKSVLIGLPSWWDPPVPIALISSGSEIDL